MKKLTVSELAARFMAGDHYGILTHRRPDGDTVGCAALLCRALRALGKEAWILDNPDITPKYAPYWEGLTCPMDKPGLYLVSVDVASETLFPKGAGALEGQVRLLVDHHGSNTGFAPEGLVETKAAACGEIVLELAEKLGVKLDKPMAEAGYLALSTDTGCFRYANTTAATLRWAAACLEAGAGAYAINRAMFETTRFARLRLNAYLTEHMEFYAGGKVALCSIPGELERELGITADDMDDVSSFPRNVEGVQVAVTLRDTADGTKLSVRAAPGYNASEICGYLGGGGHPGAAGASVAMPREEAAQAVLEAMRKTGIEL